MTDTRVRTAVGGAVTPKPLPAALADPIARFTDRLPRDSGRQGPDRRHRPGPLARSAGTIRSHHYQHDAHGGKEHRAGDARGSTWRFARPSPVRRHLRSRRRFSGPPGGGPPVPGSDST